MTRIDRGGNLGNRQGTVGIGMHRIMNWNDLIPQPALDCRVPLAQRVQSGPDDLAG
jgi:hypothetical protein